MLNRLKRRPAASANPLAVGNLLDHPQLRNAMGDVTGFPPPRAGDRRKLAAAAPAQRRAVRVEGDPLAIRDLLDDPRLRAAMGMTAPTSLSDRRTAMQHRSQPELVSALEGAA